MIGLTEDIISPDNPTFARIMADIKRRNFGNGLYKTFLFIHIAKTAGVSVNASLGIYGRQHLTAREFEKALGKENYLPLYKFTIVRNPWDRVVSQYGHLWHQMAGDFPSFSEWVKLMFGSHLPKAVGAFERIVSFRYRNKDYDALVKPYLPQTEWLKGADGKISIDFIGRFEKLNQDFRELQSNLGLPIRKLAHKNKSRRAPNYRNIYDDESCSLIADFYKDDIIEFGYSY